MKKYLKFPLIFLIPSLQFFFLNIYPMERNTLKEPLLLLNKNTIFAEAKKFSSLLNYFNDCQKKEELILKDHSQNCNGLFFSLPIEILQNILGFFENYAVSDHLQYFLKIEENEKTTQAFEKLKENFLRPAIEKFEFHNILYSSNSTDKNLQEIGLRFALAYNGYDMPVVNLLKISCAHLFQNNTGLWADVRPPSLKLHQVAYTYSTLAIKNFTLPIKFKILNFDFRLSLKKAKEIFTPYIERKELESLLDKIAHYSCSLVLFLSSLKRDMPILQQDIEHILKSLKEAMQGENNLPFTATFSPHPSFDKNFIDNIAQDLNSKIDFSKDLKELKNNSSANQFIPIPLAYLNKWNSLVILSENNALPEIIKFKV